MTATEVLRRLLDERGVEWEDGGEGLTIIPAQDGVPRAWTVNTWPSGKDMGDCLWVQNRHPLTPEQAIAATLGRGKLSASQVSNAVYAHSIHADCADADWQAIADELNATLGRGTCRKVYLVEVSDDLIDSWHPLAVYLYREIAEDCAETLRKDEIRQFTRVSELKVVSA